jgi:hypothetical protein
MQVKPFYSLSFVTVLSGRTEKYKQLITKKYGLI